MTFQEILPKFLKGAKIRKTSWTKQYVFINNKNVIVDENNNVCHLQGHNLVEDEWEIYDDREYFDFNRAYKLMKEGKKVRRKSIYTDDENYYMFIDKNNGYFDDINSENFGIQPDDIEAKDWYLVED